MRKFLVVFVLLMVAGESFSQSFYAIRRERSLIFSGGTGTSTYLGELSNPGDYLDAKPNLNFGFQHYVTNRIVARADVTWFTLGGDDANSNAPGPSRKERNLSFSSNNYEISLTGAVNMFPNGDRYYRRPMFNAYGFAGIGVMYYNPKTSYNGEKVALRPLQTEGVSYSSFGFVIPFGLGVKMKVTPMFNISLEGGMRMTFTDYLDDVSTVHKDPASFSDPIAAALADRRPEIGKPALAAGSKRGNPGTNDYYMLVNARVEYYLPWAFGSSQSNYTKKRKSFKSKRR